MNMLFQSEMETPRIPSNIKVSHTESCIVVETELNILVATAFSVGLLHTLFGPDHYIPFVAMAKCNKWSSRKTLSVTALCGLGHVAGSIAIGFVGLMLGSVLFHIEAFETLRGNGAAWLLIGFGLAYFTWGVVQAVRDVPHTHLHAHSDGTVHSHLHQHDAEHRHVHDQVAVEEPQGMQRRSLTPWILFVIFVFGPCEVLIPLLMYPAAEANLTAMLMVVAAFSIATIGTMVASVMILVFGMNFVRLPDLHRYSHAVAGLAVLACGTLVKFGL